MYRACHYVFGAILFAVLVVMQALAEGDMTSVKLTNTPVENSNEIVLDVTVSGNTGFSYNAGIVSYDKNVLELVEIDTEGTLMSNATTNIKTGKIAFASARNILDDGTLYRLKFKVLDGMADASSVSVSTNMRAASGSYLAKDLSTTVTVTMPPTPPQQESTPVPEQSEIPPTPTPVPEQSEIPPTPTLMPEQSESTPAPTPTQSASPIGPMPAPTQKMNTPIATVAPISTPWISPSALAPVTDVNSGNTGDNGSSSTVNVPKTGDESAILWWVLILAIDSVGIFFVLRLKRGKEHS